MSLGIYSLADPSSAFSTDASFSNPLAITADGVVGGSAEKRLYVRNDDPLLSYSNIEIVAIDGGDLIVDGTRGYSWKLMAGDQRPLKEQWDAIDPGNTLELSDTIEDSTTYLPFWIQVTVPEGADVISYQSVRLQITADEAII